jgi:hypothetical protein
MPLVADSAVMLLGDDGTFISGGSTAHQNIDSTWDRRIHGSGRIDRYLSEIHSAGLGATTIAQLAIVTATLCYAVGPSLAVISLVTHRSFPAAGSMIYSSVFTVPLPRPAIVGRARVGAHRRCCHFHAGEAGQAEHGEVASQATINDLPHGLRPA